MKKSKRLFPAQLSLWLKLRDFQMLAFFIAGLVFGGARQSKMITAVEYKQIAKTI